MTNQTNEIANVINEVAAEIKEAKTETFGTWEEVSRDENYITYKDNTTGKPIRKQIYKQIKTFNPQGRKEKVKMLSLLSEATPFKKATGQIIMLGGFMTEPYTSIDEETNNLLHGVTTTLISADMQTAFVTSSKTTYNSLMDIYNALGDEIIDLDDPLAIEITSRKGDKGEIMDIKVKE